MLLRILTSLTLLAGSHGSLTTHAVERRVNRLALDIFSHNSAIDYSDVFVLLSNSSVVFSTFSSSQSTGVILRGSMAFNNSGNEHYTERVSSCQSSVEIFVSNDVSPLLFLTDASLLDLTCVGGAYRTDAIEVSVSSKFYLHSFLLE